MSNRAYTMTDAARKARVKGAAAANKVKREKARKLGGYAGMFIPLAVLREIDNRRGKLPRWRFVAELMGVKNN